jgi:amino acid transporter
MSICPASTSRRDEIRPLRKIMLGSFTQRAAVVYAASPRAPGETMGKPESYERLGTKRLSLLDVIAQSVGFTGPVFSSAFVIPLVVGVISASGKGGGIASPLSVLLAAIGVFALGWIISAYAKEVHAAGSLYDYVTRGLGERVGTAAGWLYYGGVTVLVTVLLLLIGGYLQSTIAAEFGVNPLPAWAWTLLLIALVTAVLYFGVRISTRSQLALALVSMLVVLIFFIFVIVKLGSANSLRPFTPSSAADGWPGIFFGVLYGVLLFVGFETAANLAEETPNPRREIPIAIMTTATIATVFFVVATYVEVAGFHYSLKTLTAAAGAPLFALGAGRSAGGYGGTWIDRLLELVVLFDMIAVAIGSAVAASRGFFAMARDRRIPACLAVVSKRHGTPLGATIFLLGASLATLLIDLFWTGLFALPRTPHYFALFSWGATFGGFALVVVYLLMCAGSLRSFAGAGNRVRLGAAAVVGIVITAGAIFGSFYKVTSPAIWAPWLALALLALGFVSTFFLRARVPASIQLADLSARPAP